MGPLGQTRVDDPGHGQPRQGGPGRRRSRRPQADRGDHPGDDAGERRDPTILNGSRRRRIAAGSGTTLPDVNRLVKQFSEMQKLMKQLSGSGGRRAALGALSGRR